MDTKLIGKNIALLRKRNGHTQEALAEKLNISPQAVSKWETGAGLPEASALIKLAELYCVSIDELLRADKPRNIISDFITRNLAIPDRKLLNWIPRISRWNPPEGCDMWYSFPAAISEVLVCTEAQEAGRVEITYTELNERFRDLMHITGLGYGFLWNNVKRHLIEELWHVNDISEMVAQVMGYYGRDYLWLTPGNATIEEARRIVMWSIAQNRPVVMEWPGGIPEFNVVTGYEDSGETLIGYTYCEECAAKMNEYGMFVNPARWGEPWGNGSGFRILIIGDKSEPTITDRDTIEYALKVLAKNEADDKEFFLTNELIAGDAALYAWREACNTAEHTIELFTKPDLYTHALYMNTIYAQNCVLPYYKKLGARNNRRVNDIAIQIDIALGRITSDRHNSGKGKDDGAVATAYRKHIENLISHRGYMRGWLRELLEVLD
jgi:transcriptional regulator with XRE-family HTH domain